jgi:hypothetical protein
MAELKIEKINDLSKVEVGRVNREIIWQGLDFILLHHVNEDILYYRKVDEFILYMTGDNDEVVKKCQQYIELYNKVAEHIRDLEHDFFEYSYPDEYPEEEVDNNWIELEEQWSEIKGSSNIYIDYNKLNRKGIGVDLTEFYDSEPIFEGIFIGFNLGPIYRFGSVSDDEVYIFDFKTEKIKVISNVILCDYIKGALMSGILQTYDIISLQKINNHKFKKLDCYQFNVFEKSDRILNMKIKNTDYITIIDKIKDIIPPLMWEYKFSLSKQTLDKLYQIYLEYLDKIDELGLLNGYYKIEDIEYEEKEDE